jgi:glycosyltransferase involved in cell wall biosynthesis
MNILHIHDYPPFEGGGIEINVSRVSAHMVKLGHQVQIATPRFSSETYETNGVLEREGVQAVRLVSLTQLHNLIDAADVVNVHFTFSCRAATMQAIEYCVQNNIKCIVTIRTSYEHVPFSAIRLLTDLEKDVMFSKLRQLLQSPNVVLSAPSSCIRDSLTQVGVERELTVIHNGTALGATNKTKDLDVVDITYIGEISVLKGVQYLIESINRLKVNFPNIKARFVGAGSELAYMQQQVAALDLNSNIEFVGYVPHSQIINYLTSTRIHVHPSLTEVWPGAVLESLALGNLVVASSVGGIPEMTQQGELAYLFAKGDTLALATILQDLLQQGVQPGSNQLAREYVSSHFTIEQQTQNILFFYSQIYGK